MRKYRLISKRGEGTFSEVIKAQNTKTGNFYAIKCMKSAYKSAEQVRIGTVIDSTISSRLRSCSSGLTQRFYPHIGKQSS